MRTRSVPPLLSLTPRRPPVVAGMSTTVRTLNDSMKRRSHTGLDYKTDFPMLGRLRPSTWRPRRFGFIAGGIGINPNPADAAAGRNAWRGLVAGARCCGRSVKVAANALEDSWNATADAVQDPV